MVMEITEDRTQNVEKVLVCITAQSNSKRLIDKGAEIADKYNGELHILHVLRGSNVFNSAETLRLLQQLFLYAGAKGGMVHSYCEDNVSGNIAGFVEQERITKVILGQPPLEPQKKSKKQDGSLFANIVNTIPAGVDVIIVKREQEPSKKMVEKNVLIS